MAGRCVVFIAALLLIPAASHGDEPKVAGGGNAALDFPRAEPGELGIDKAALERLRDRAKEADSDAVVIIKDGRLVADWDFGRPRGPIEAMSATKSIVSLAIGKLIDEGKIQSLDQPIYRLLSGVESGTEEAHHRPPSAQPHQRAPEPRGSPPRSTPAPTSSSSPWPPT